jgi:hypothetical protein
LRTKQSHGTKKEWIASSLGSSQGRSNSRDQIKSITGEDDQ